ncbi:hypothetical protein Hanom_Chr17g01550421 [Helianthus anomalus]
MLNFVSLHFTLYALCSKNWKQVQHNLYLLIQVSVKCARILKCVLAWLWSGYIELLPIYVADLKENGGNIKKFCSIIHLFNRKM